MINFRDNPH